MSIDKSAWGYDERNPDNETVMVEELTPEQIFCNSKVDVPEHALVYIEHLEQRVKSKNNACTEALKLLQDTSQSFARNQISKIKSL